MCILDIVGTISIVPGDQLVFDFKQSLPSYGGLAFIFTNNDGTGAVVDSGGTGEPLYFDQESDGAWHHMVGDLTPYVGETVAYPLVGLHSYMPSGTFDMYYANAEVLHQNGTVTPVFPAQVASVNGIYGTSCGGQNITSATELTPTTDPAVNTTYYLDDHLGTTQMELSAGGWPLWVGQFTPFGAELPDGTTAMHYKFTGKERDAETGLDYFGARYLGTNMGRWMSPDPSGLGYAEAENPQTLNLYAYVGNNPLSFVDPNGMLTCSTGAGPAGVNTALNSVVNFFHTIGCAIQDAVETSGGEGATFSHDGSGSTQQQNNQRLISVSGTEKLALAPLVEHYAFGRGTDYTLSAEAFNGFISEMRKEGRLNGDQIPVPGMPEGVTQQLVDAQGTSYALSAGHTTVYYLNGQPAGYRDLWDFDAKPAGQRTPKAEIETRVGDVLLNKVVQGTPFWVEYGIHPH